MVDEADVSALHRAAFLHLGPERAARVSWRAGRLTGDYLLKIASLRRRRSCCDSCRAPSPARLLLSAVARHAWTFVGSGRFSYSFASCGSNSKRADLPSAADRRQGLRLFRSDLRTPVPVRSSRPMRASRKSNARPSATPPVCFAWIGNDAPAPSGVSPCSHCTRAVKSGRLPRIRPPGGIARHRQDRALQDERRHSGAHPGAQAQAASAVGFAARRETRLARDPHDTV